MFESPFSPTTSSAFVQHHEEDKVYQTLEEAVSDALKQSNDHKWEIGRIAHAYHNLGGLDLDLANAMGVGRNYIYYRRCVWARFGGKRSEYNHNLSWTHFREAVGWDDGEECIEWAFEMQATVAEMRAWRRAQNGEDLIQPADADDANDEDDEVNEPEDDNMVDDVVQAFEDDETEEINPVVEEQAGRAPVDGSGNSGEASSESGKSGEPSEPETAALAGTAEGSTEDPKFDVSKAIMRVRKICREATSGLADSEEELEEFADELKSWEKKMRPSKRFIPPTLAEVQEYIKIRNSPIDPQQFVEYYETNNWRFRDGKKMKNWKQAVLTWENIRKKGRAGGITDSGEQDVFERFLNR